MPTQPRVRRERGQILVLFVLALVAMFAMAGLLLDGGQALTVRRQLQDASDSAALAAANLMQTAETVGGPKGCSATAGPPPGSPRSSLVTAAQDAVHRSLPNVANADILVSCPSGWKNAAVQVSLASTSSATFSRIIGMTSFGVGTTSQALNGQVTGTRFSVVLLDKSNPTWPNGRRGCPSALISGGPTITFEGAMMIDSSCSSANGGGLGTNGNSASLTLTSPADIEMVGDYVPGVLTINPAPVTHVSYVKDPLSGLPRVNLAALPVRANSKVTISGGDQILEPGVYNGGIQMKNQARAFLHPGIYVMNGYGFNISAGNEVYSIPSSVTNPAKPYTTWTTDCTTTNCGVLLYYTGITTSTPANNQITIGAGATLKLRPYNPDVDGTGLSESAYKNMLLWQDGYWQDGTPAPTSGSAQPEVSLSGGGSVDLSGTIYAPAAAVTMGGGSGGSGGGTDVTLQFICWDLTLQGNSSFHFYYRSDAFATPTDYGLIQ